MKEGRSIQELAAELQRQQAAKRDYVSPAMSLKAITKEQVIATTEGQKTQTVFGLTIDGVPKPFGLTTTGHQQLATYLKIPREYYERCREEIPTILANDVNAWLTKKPTERRMVRTLDRKVRAILSPRYRRLDNADLAEAVLPEIASAGAVIASSQVTESRLYLQATLPSLSRDVSIAHTPGNHDIGHGRVTDTTGMKRGDIVQAFVAIRNSEIGAGSIAVEPGVYRLSCLNGLIMPDYAMRKYHVGRLIEAEGELTDLFSDEAKKADDRAFWLKVRDVVRAAFDPQVFEMITDRIKKAAGEELPGAPAKVVDVTAKKFGFSEDLSRSVLAHLMAGNDLSKWGLVNAVTRASSDVESYDYAVELERTGGAILETPIEQLAA